MSLKIAFLGAKEIGAFCLQYLLESAPALNYEVVGVRTREGAAGEKIKKITKDAGLILFSSLEGLPEVDIIISVQHHELLKQKDIAKARKVAVNLHLAPLPEYRGCNQFSLAILEEAQEFGVTLHQMDCRIDHGAILFEKRFPVPENCWVKELHELAVKEGEELFVESLPDLISGHFILKEQNTNNSGKQSRLHFRKEMEHLKVIPLDLPKEEI
jgi:methionyl-tRNA formyltransferase